MCLPRANLYATNNLMNSSTIRKVLCPHCKKEALYSIENPSRPFCSERCRMIDLGQWADESYKVPIQNEELDSTWNQQLQDDEE